jgi:hypothetical protein
MKSQVVSALLALVGTVSAQTMHVVTVGNGGLQFCPEQITAATGDLIQFQFYPNVYPLRKSLIEESYCHTRVLRGRMHAHFRSSRCNCADR